MAGTLFVVGTPIGNLDDISARALKTLRSVDRVVAEDTRRTRALLTHFGISKRLSVLEAHTSPAAVGKLVDELEGADLALVTDAGMPSVSDPGSALVKAARAAGTRVVPIPGPSAVTTAIAASGLVEGPFLFLGFIPRKGEARRGVLERIARTQDPVVLFEAPNRTAATLADLAKSEPERQACVARELTKLHEELVWGTLQELASLDGGWRGEVSIVLGLGAAPDERVSDEALDARIRQELSAGKGTRQIASDLAPWAGRPRRELYNRVLELSRRD